LFIFLMVLYIMAKSRRMKKMRGGADDAAAMPKGMPASAPAMSEEMPMSGPAMPTDVPMTGGRRRRGSKRHSKRRGSKRSGSKRRHVKKGGNGVIATAAVPFGLLALQRYFKGSRTSKKGVRQLGTSFKRTFRRRH
jgi:hypothetical protein